MNTGIPIVRHPALLFSLLFLLSCCNQQELIESSKKNVSEHSISEDEASLGQYTLTIRCVDLSEDNVLATKNDELLILLYAPADQVSSPVFAQMQSVNEDFEASWNVQSPLHLDAEFLLVLLEMDSKKNVSQIEPVIRVHQDELRNAYALNDKNRIRQLLGDDDLLGLGVLTRSAPAMDLEGIHLFDTYHYKISLDPR